MNRRKKEEQGCFSANGKRMERILDYVISVNEAGMTIKDFLKEKGYSRQNVVELKKMPESILVNGRWEYVTYRLCEGEQLQIHIQELESSKKLIEKLKLAFERNATVSQVALAWLLKQKVNTFPIVSASTSERIAGNVKALELNLTDEEVKWLNLEK